MSHAISKSKPDNSKPQSPPTLTVYYTNVRGLKGNFKDLEAFMLKINPDIFALCETNLHADIQDSCLATCQSIARMLDICTAVVFMLRAIFRWLDKQFLRVKTSLICVFVWLFYILLPSYFSCMVRHLRHLVLWLRLCHPIDKSLILQTSANIMVCGDFNAHNTEWLCHSHTTDVAGLFCHRPRQNYTHCL